MKIRSSSQRSSGFTLVEIMIVVGLVGMLAGLAVPSIAKARDSARLNIIYDNLRALETAKQQWAVENNKNNGDSVDNLAVLDVYFHNGGLRDVIRETYVPNAVGIPAEANLPDGVTLGPYGPGAAIPAP